MYFYTITALVLISLLLLCTAGCTTNLPYRTTLDRPNTPNSVIETTPEYKLGFVEFDDQGWFYDVRQKAAVETMIRTEAGIGTQNETPVILVLFVHGWKNNAASDNGNVNTFRAVLKQLNDLEVHLSQIQKRNPRKLIGVYGGWRGLSIKSDYFPLPLGKELSFWGRKNTAQRVGGYGGMTELMMDLETLQATSNRSLPASAATSKLIIVGHSFGADVVYNALSQIITERFVDTIKEHPGSLLKPVGDQVILLNPAFEASRLYDLKQLARSVTNYAPDQRPVLSVFQSKGDWATGDVFPVGQRLGTMFQSCRTNFQKQANIKAVGWFEPFFTHQLVFDTHAATANDGKGNAASEKVQLRASGKLPETIKNITTQRHIWRTATAQVTTNVFGPCIMISSADYQPRNPIVVVTVDKRIMKDHDDIANPNLINFLQEYIPFCDNDQ